MSYSSMGVEVYMACSQELVGRAMDRRDRQELQNLREGMVSCAPDLGEMAPEQAGSVGQDTARVAGALRVLADPTRLRIYLLLRQGEACVCELAAALGLAENLVSHHLSVLRRAGLTCDRRDASDARWVYYQLDAAALGALFAELGALFDPRTLGTRTPTCGPAAAPSQLIAPPTLKARGSRA